jgi:hypothetical protein
VAVIDLEEDKKSGNDINKVNYGQECDAEKRNSALTFTRTMTTVKELRSVIWSKSSGVFALSK